MFVICETNQEVGRTDSLDLKSVLYYTVVQEGEKYEIWATTFAPVNPGVYICSRASFHEAQNWMEKAERANSIQNKYAFVLWSDPILISEP